MSDGWCTALRYSSVGRPDSRSAPSSSQSTSCTFPSKKLSILVSLSWRMLDTPYSLRHTAVATSFSAALRPSPPLPRTYLRKSVGVKASTHALSIVSLSPSLSARARSSTTPIASTSLLLALCPPNLVAARCSDVSSRSAGTSPTGTARSSSSTAAEWSVSAPPRRAMAPKTLAVTLTASLSTAVNSPSTAPATAMRSNRVRASRSWRERSLDSRPVMSATQAPNIQKSASSVSVPAAEKEVGVLERSSGRFLVEQDAGWEVGDWRETPVLV
mmetsp:Transcript_20212/g.46579  ORF Transcript_20212/g.46579 Transcript_20212/m.46579 type:complete len:272 (-) Transcript_20212:211-1026(-)